MARHIKSDTNDQESQDLVDDARKRARSNPIIAAIIIGALVLFFIAQVVENWNSIFSSNQDKLADNKILQSSHGKENIQQVATGDFSPAINAEGNVTVTYQGLSENERTAFYDQSDPKVKVSVDNKKPTEFVINIFTTEHLLTLAIDLPVLGKIKSIHDYNSVADAQPPLKQVTGSQTARSQNNVELYIENIKPNVKLSYKVIFEPMNKEIYVAGADRYQVSYTWNFRGNILSKEKWISLETGEEVWKPNIQVRGTTIYNRALTPEEIKKLYEQGPSKQKFD